MEKLKKRCTDVLAEVENIVEKLRDYKDEQWVLDFCDKLNHFSTLY